METKRGIIEALRDALLGRDDAEAVATGSKGRPDKPGHGPVAPRNASQFENHLRTLLADREMLSAGRLQVLSLDKIKERIGERWARHADHVQSVVEEIFTRRLTPADVYTRIGDVTHLILFSSLNRAEAKIKATLLAEEIATRLIGREEAPDFVDVETVVIDVDREMAAEKTDLIGAVTELMDKEAADEASGDGGMDEGTSALIAAASGLSPEALRGLTPSAVVRSYAPVNTEPPKDLGFVFRPMWAVERRILSTYLCVIVKRGENGTVGDDYSALYASDQPAMIARLDQVTLGRIEREIESLAGKNQKLLIGCPVHYHTLNRGTSRAAYLMQCKRIPDWFRPYVVFEVVGFPEAIPQGRVAEIAGILKPYSRSVLARLEKGHQNFQSFANANLHAVGMDVALYGLPEERMMAILSQFVGAASDVGLKTYVHGLRSRSLTVAALAAGFDYVHSHVAHAAVASPDYARRYQFSDLYADLLPRDG